MEHSIRSKRPELTRYKAPSELGQDTDWGQDKTADELDCGNALLLTDCRALLLAEVVRTVVLIVVKMDELYSTELSDAEPEGVLATSTVMVSVTVVVRQCQSWNA